MDRYLEAGCGSVGTSTAWSTPTSARPSWRHGSRPNRGRPLPALVDDVRALVADLDAGDGDLDPARRRWLHAQAAGLHTAARQLAGEEVPSSTRWSSATEKTRQPNEVASSNRYVLLFDIVPSVPAVELAEGGEVRFGEIRLRVLHTPGHTEGSVCLYEADGGRLFSGDTLFAGGWGRVDLPGGDPVAMVASLGRLLDLEDAVGVFPGHGDSTTIGRERAWLELVRSEGRLLA